MRSLGMTELFRFVVTNSFSLGIRLLLLWRCGVGRQLRSLVGAYLHPRFLRIVYLRRFLLPDVWTAFLHVSLEQLRKVGSSGGRLPARKNSMPKLIHRCCYPL